MVFYESVFPYKPGSNLLPSESASPTIPNKLCTDSFIIIRNPSINQGPLALPDDHNNQNEGVLSDVVTSNNHETDNFVVLSVVLPTVDTLSVYHDHTVYHWHWQQIGPQCFLLLSP